MGLLMIVYNICGLLILLMVFPFNIYIYIRIYIYIILVWDYHGNIVDYYIMDY